MPENPKRADYEEEMGRAIDEEIVDTADEDEDLEDIEDLEEDEGLEGE